MGNKLTVDFTPPLVTPVENRLYYDYIRKMNNHDFDIENIVLEGGGAKGYAYCGAIQVLEEIGIWEKVKRLAGTSAGSICAAMFSVGYTSAEVRSFLDQTQAHNSIFLDHSWGLTTFTRNIYHLWNKFGWNNGDGFLAFLGQIFEHKVKKADITFQEVYEKYGKELCVVVTNVNRMDAEYCHVKTTPHMPVRVAVRMSMSIPFMFEAVPYNIWNQGKIDSPNYYVDGGVLVNYPLHCYDGWYLSMRNEDAFLNKLRDFKHISELYDMESRFGQFNSKTLGFLVFSNDEAEVFRPIMDERNDNNELKTHLKIPNTKMARKFHEKKTSNAKVERHALTFLQGLKQTDQDGHNVREEDIQLLIDQKENRDMQDALHFLFGPVTNAHQIFTMLQQKGDEHRELEFIDITSYLREKGLDIRSQFLGYEPQELTGMISFTKCLISGMMRSGQRLLVKDEDILRTVGINTRYVKTVSTEMEQEDRDFLINQGRTATVTFLQSKYKNKLINDLYPNYLR